MPTPPTLVLPGDASDPNAPIVACDACGCIVLVALLAAHDRACPGRTR